MDEELEISIKDLLYRICTKWRTILISMVIAGVLFGLLGGIQSYRSVKQAEQALQIQQENGGPAEGEEAVIVPEFQPISIKYIVLGMFIGIFLSALVYFFKYIFSAKLRYKDDLFDLFQIPLLGYLPHYEKYGKAGSKADTKLAQMFWKQEFRFSEEERMDMICTDLQLSMNQKNLRQICCLGTAPIDETVVQKMQQHFPEENELTILPKPIINSPSELQNLVQYDGVVLIETIGKSLYEDIKQELEYCARYEIPVLGYLVVG